MIQFFAYWNKPYVTGMNKLLFYADFCHFKEYGHAISGLSYKALPKGPVPDNYGSLYNYVVKSNLIKVQEREFQEYVGDQFFTNEPLPINSPFKESELLILKKISDRFKGKNTRQIVEISHEEPAWLDNVGEFGMISFEYGFKLKNGS